MQVGELQEKFDIGSVARISGTQAVANFTAQSAPSHRKTTTSDRNTSTAIGGPRMANNLDKLPVAVGCTREETETRCHSQWTMIVQLDTSLFHGDEATINDKSGSHSERIRVSAFVEYGDVSAYTDSFFAPFYVQKEATIYSAALCISTYCQ